MSNSLSRYGSKLLPGLVITAALAGCADHHDRGREPVATTYERYGPLVVDDIAILDDPDPFVVERERFFVRRPEDIRIVNNEVFFRGVRIDDPREARAARLALQAREEHRERVATRAREAKQAREARARVSADVMAPVGAREMSAPHGGRVGR
jgi:hypothetical protein